MSRSLSDEIYLGVGRILTQHHPTANQCSNRQFLEKHDLWPTLWEVRKQNRFGGNQRNIYNPGLVRNSGLARSPVTEPSKKGPVNPASADRLGTVIAELVLASRMIGFSKSGLQSLNSGVHWTWGDRRLGMVRKYSVWFPVAISRGLCFTRSRV